MTAERLGYQYVVLRLVPDITREEFLNVAVVLHCQAVDYLEVGFELHPWRWSALGSSVDVDEVDRSLGVVRQVCAGERVPGLPDLPRPGQRFGWLAAPRSTVLQPGPVHGGTTDDTASELDRLTDRLVR